MEISSSITTVTSSKSIYIKSPHRWGGNALLIIGYEDPQDLNRTMISRLFIIVFLFSALVSLGVGNMDIVVAADETEVSVSQASHDQFPPRTYNNATYRADTNGMLRRYDQHENIVWQRHFQGWVYPPALLQNRLITAGSEAILWGLDADSGEIIWSIKLPQEAVYRVTIANNIAIVTTFDGSITAVNAEGKVLWEKKFEVASGSPLSHSGHLYLPGFDGRIRTLEAATGQIVWVSDRVGQIVAEPSAYGQHIYVASEPAALHVLNAANGHLIRTHLLPADPVGPITQHTSNIQLFLEQKGHPPIPHFVIR